MYLHHEDDGVERNQSHDAVLEGRRNYKLPHAILEAEFILRHVASQRPGVDGEIYTGSLWEGRKRELHYITLRRVNRRCPNIQKNPSSPRSFLSYSPPSSYPPVPGR